MRADPANHAETGDPPFFAAPIPAFDEAAADAARRHQEQLTKPRGSLGALEALAIHLAGLQGNAFPRCRPAAVCLFASDHPIARHGVSAYPQAVTAAMVTNYAQGGAAASVLARRAGLPLHVVDVGVATPYARPPGVVRAAVAELDEGDARFEAAMTPEVFALALAAGRAAVDRLEPATRLVILGEMGIANSTLAAALAAALLGEPAEAMTGKGTGVEGAAFEGKRAVVREMIARLPPDAAPDEVLRQLGGRELAALAGAAARAIERRIVVLVDGFIVSAALLALVRSAPAAAPFLLFAHRSAEPGHAAVLAALGARPLLDLGLRLGEGSGALAAFPLVEAAVELHRGMATFASAGVPDREEP